MATNSIKFNPYNLLKTTSGYGSGVTRTLTWPENIIDGTVYLLLVKNFLSANTVSFDLYIVGPVEGVWNVTNVFQGNNATVTITSITHSGKVATLTFSGTTYSSIAMMRMI